VIECPDGNEYLSGGKIRDQQCGSISHGRFRRLARFNVRNTKIPKADAVVPAPIARNLSAPPKIAKINAIEYQSQPSPNRVMVIIKMRNHRGARQR
jgi:hypothetical protein